MRTKIEVDNGEPLARLRRMLDAADIDDDSIESIVIEVIHDDRVVEVDDINEQYPEAEYGPTEPEREGHKKGGGGTYDGILPSNLFMGEAIRPDSKRGRVLEYLFDKDNWFERSEVAEALDMTKSEVSDSFSRLFNDEGYVKRRKIENTGKKGIQREYTTTESGRNAIREGRRIAQEYREQKRQDEEDEMKEKD